ncbi:MAG: MBL fold metallo-hydrolase [Pseudomonadota bacterium]
MSSPRPIVNSLLITLLAVSSASAETSLTVLYDAFGPAGAFERDWGFSALLRHDGRNILIDTGSDPGVFARNAARAGVDLANLDAVILTHRHMDHLGGLPAVLAEKPQVPIYAPHEPFGQFGSELPASIYSRDGSLPRHLRFFDGRPPASLRFGSAWPDAAIVPVTGHREIFPGVHLLANRTEHMDSHGLHEVSLAIETPRGLVVIVGCSHPGVESIVASAQAIDTPVALVVGGFHLPAATDEAIDRTSAALKALGVGAVAPAHCSGEVTMARLREQWHGRFVETGVGRRIDLEPGSAEPAG